tara:strand:+ start:398 stop:1660 length:1263 start_codon:yes stop_codon:yes gene_type:complete
LKEDLLVSTLTIKTPEVFKPLFEPNLRYIGIWGGRGSGKSHHLAERAIDEMIGDPKTRIVAIREVQKSLRESAYRLLCDKIEDLGVGNQFRILNDRIETYAGGSITFMGMQDHTAESIKSMENIRIVWCEESQTLSRKSLELLRPTIRAKGSQLWFGWNPRSASDPVDKLFRGANTPDNCAVVQVNYNDNPWFPKELDAERLFDKKNYPDRYHHVWCGGYEPQAKGAIFNMANIHENRVIEPPTMGRILVSVDPAISNTENSDEHGIVVGGLGEDQKGYVLDDVSLKGSPQQWAERAIAAFDKWDADSIVVERNQGGDMVRHTLKTIRPNINIIDVVATRGKHVRAEPISALYAMNQISHYGSFPDLEAQMCRMTAQGFEGDGSPDRVDAMVWLFSKLFPSIITKSKPRTSNRQPSSWMS